MKKTHPFEGGVSKPPTLRHRPVIWENMLGTVYAANPAGEVKYFDYDWEAAREWAAITTESDLRVARASQATNGWRHWRLPNTLRPTQLALWAIPQ